MRTVTTRPIIGLALAEALPDAQCFGEGDLYATSCTSDADAVRPGDVYFAVEEADCDGHELAERAVKRGTIALVVERPLPLFGTPQFIVPDARVAYGQFCQRLVGAPSEQFPVIGIAGSAGKTSAATLLRSILRAAGLTIGHVAGDELGDGVLTRSGCSGRPSAPALATWLSRMAINDCSHAVIEITSDMLRRRLTAGITLDVACLTNMDVDCRQPYKNLNATRQMLAEVTEMLPPNGVAVLNADDPGCARLQATLDGPTLTFGMRRPAEITARIVHRNACEQVFLLSTGHDCAAVRTTIIGDSHVYNCLAAAAIATVYNIGLPTIARGLESVTCLQGVMQRIDSGQEFCTYVDRARSSRSLESCLAAAREVTRGRVITVVRGSAVGTDSPLCRTARKLSDTAVFVSRSGSQPDVITAIAEACLRAATGDVVVVTGPNRETEEHEGKAWDDAEVIRKLLRQLPA